MQMGARIYQHASVKKTVRKACLDINHFIEAKKLKFKVTFDPKAKTVNIHQKYLSTILRNLLDNAVKFTQKGGIVLSTKSQGDNIKIIVKDTGCGIPSKDIDKIFDAFYKRHTAIPGMGLGLSICKEIVDMYNGKILVASRGDGKGTKVTVYLPKA
jgi:signal transduction histidine kinase